MIFLYVHQNLGFKVLEIHFFDNYVSPYCRGLVTGLILHVIRNDPVKGRLLLGLPNCHLTREIDFSLVSLVIGLDTLMRLGIRVCISRAEFGSCRFLDKGLFKSKNKCEIERLKD
jgi:hypothetical protein